MRNAISVTLLRILVCGWVSRCAAAAADADPPENPYMRAVAVVAAVSPAGSNLEYPAVPPYGAEWDRMAAESFSKNAAVFPIVRAARDDRHVSWGHGSAAITPLNRTRNLANVVGDAALYQHLQGDDHAAVELVRDVLAMSRSLRTDLEPDDAPRLYVSIGIDALAMYKLMTIATTVHLSDDPKDAKALQTSDAKRLIKQLLTEPSSISELERLQRTKPDPSSPVQGEHSRARENLNRAESELALTAMSLACHVFHHRSGRWPATLKELATELPRVPIDPWGDGKQTFGYLLVKGDKPDEPERPLVYSRCASQDGMFYRIDAPQVGFYADDGTPERKHGGQFRDVTLWQPQTGLEGIVGPTTRPVQP
jgi:hypothetical protein